MRQQQANPTTIELMRIALAQINPVVGDISGNTELILAKLNAARDQGADLVVYPELAVIGYPPKDLLLKPAVIEDCGAAVSDLADHCRDIAAIIGYPCPAKTPHGLTLHNAAAFCYNGRIQHRHVKNLLPTYDVFDEHRYFEPGPEIDIVPYKDFNIGISICEDMWNDSHVFKRRLYKQNPIDRLAERGADLFINCAASPFVLDKQAFRLKLMGHVASRFDIPLFYCNQVGGNDELIFDGNSCAFDNQGRLIAHAGDFIQDLLVVDLPDRRAERIHARIEHYHKGIASVYHALVLGLQDYCRKCGFQSVVIGLSGGIDSAVAAAIAVAAIGKDHVRGIAMPSRYSSTGSVNDARALAERLGIMFHVIPIEQPHQAFEQLLEPHFRDYPQDTTEENIQARLRGVILMAFSNKYAGLLITTGNKSEVAVGYCTLYGDMAGGLAVLSDLPKTKVYELAEWINNDPASPLRINYGQGVIPQATIEKPPSAELRENQVDQDTLPPYEILDEIIERYVEQELPTDRIIEQTRLDPALVRNIIRLIDMNEYKRKQMPPGLKVTGRAFGFGRRMPIAQQYHGYGKTVM